MVEYLLFLSYTKKKKKELNEMFRTEKQKRILKNEKTLATLHGNVMMTCSHPDCHNQTKVTIEESKRILQCGRCFKGFLKKSHIVQPKKK